MSLESSRIMLVDDDANVLDIVKQMLEILGTRVDAFSSCYEALDHFCRTDEVYDVVLLDIMMDEMSGLDLLEKLRDSSPAQKAILCSGYTEDTEASYKARPGETGFLQKPFSIEKLASTLEGFLDCLVKEENAC